MAGKARRAAARQGQLSRRRKKGQRGPTGAPTSPATTDEPVQHGNGVATAIDDGEAAVAVAAPATRAAPAARAARAEAAPRAPGRLRGDRPAAYNYVGPELRRIGVLSVSVLAVLIALGFVL